MSKLVEIIGDILLGAYALSVLVTLGFIAHYGATQIIEPRPWVLWTEIGVSVIAIGIAIDRFWRDIRKG